VASKTSFSCSKSLDITQADKLQKRLLAALEKGTDIELAGDQVERADTAGLQLLLAFYRTATHQGASITWKNPSEALLSSAKRLGLASELGLIST
jgi:ABC-type transporter Mla MlaB component